MLTFPCWNCGKQLKANEAHSGRKCKCKACDCVNSIPGLRQPVDDEDEYQEDNDEEVDSEEEPEDDETEALQVQQEPVMFVPSRPANWLLRFGILLLVLGILMLGYYLLIFDPTVAEYPGFRFSKRFYNDGLMNHKIVGIIAGGILSVIGSILTAAGSLRKA